jgi:pimeloyl-ACP methyl ester carboxylesterase
VAEGGITGTIVLLHGANGAREEMAPLAALLAPLGAFVPNWLGHGGRPPPGPGYSIAGLVDDLVATLDAAGIRRCFLFGYSVGGYIALALARRSPERVRGVITLATRHIWDRESVEHLVYLADPKRLTRSGNPRAAELARVHHPTDWHLVNGANRRLFADLGASPPLSDEDLRNIAAPVLVLNGANDPLVSAEESHALAGLFRTWRLGLFEGSAHPLPATPIADIAAATVAFCRDVASSERTDGLPEDRPGSSLSG